MIRTLRLLGLTLALALALPTLVLAQAPKVGDYYEDAVSLGFKVKMPKDWEFTPPQPGEGNLIGKYTPTYNKYINISPETVLWLEAYVLKFDRRKPKTDEVSVTDDGEGNKKIEIQLGDRSQGDLKEWLESSRWGQGYRVKEQKDLKIDKVPSTEFLYQADKSGSPFHVYAMVYHLEPDLDVAVVFNGPEDDKKWRKYESAVEKMAKSFKRLEIEEPEYSGPKEGDSPARSKKRGQLEAECARTPGWELYETENYFIITDNDDREFIKELMERIEAIRAVYEQLYPWADAERIKLQAAKEKKERKERGEDVGDDDEPEIEVGDGRTSTDVSSRELSRCSVLRVFKNAAQYHEYGGPGGSAGYWASFHEELVIYDDKAGGGRRDTWIVLNHEAFHQYIFYLYGSIAPHSWYNEGTGDFFSGYEYKHKRFDLKPNSWRKDTIREAIKANQHVPLKDLVRFTQSEYYGNNKFGADPGQNYAQGWSFIYFLRTGKGKASGWDASWDNILNVYFETLAATEDLDKAVDTAFAGVDWDAMEECWKAYTL
ncbi:MAG: hypothetical protein H6828_09410 [Planctomycetes bacterium]|nr:hypothetical protein [Planctomycetota bacterium]